MNAFIGHIDYHDVDVDVDVDVDEYYYYDDD